MIHARFRKNLPPGPASPGFTLDVEVQAPAGISVLFGPGGSGKTLILDAIAGFIAPDEGRILLDDEILFDAPARVNLPPRARRCGYVFPAGALFPHMTLRRNLAFAVEHRPRLERHRKVNEMLERFRLVDCAGCRPREVSASERQRAAIARALIGSPRLLLLDEPGRGLETPLRAELHAILRQVRADFRIPILLATCDLKECFELADSMLVLSGGRILQSGPPRAIAERPASVEVARLLGIFNLFQVEIAELDPQRNLSRLRLREHLLSGPYFPGKLRGDRVWLCVRPEQLSVAGRDARPGPNQIPAQLERAVELPQSVRLEFAGGLAVEISRAEFEQQKHNKEWLVEFPTQALRVL